MVSIVQDLVKKKEQLMKMFDQQINEVRRSYEYLDEKLQFFYDTENQISNLPTTDDICNKLSSTDDYEEFQKMIKKLKSELSEAGEITEYLNNSGEAEKIFDRATDIIKEVPGDIESGISRFMKKFDESVQTFSLPLKKFLEQEFVVWRAIPSEGFLKKNYQTCYLDSEIVKDKAEALCLFDWVPNDGKKRYMELLYRASRDGFTTDAIKSRCTNSGQTLTICLSDDGRKFGYYLDIKRSWTSGKKSDPKAFTFYLNDFKKCPIKQPDQAICDCSYLLHTGDSQISVQVGCDKSSNSSVSPGGTAYEKFDSVISTVTLKIKEIEVFQVVYQ